MLRRFVIFFISFSIGSLFVYFLLIKDQNRDFSFWLPENRVINEVHSFKIVLDENAKCYFYSYGLHKTGLLVKNNIVSNEILSNIHVDFAKSDPRKSPREYFFYGDSVNFYASIIKVDSVLLIHDIHAFARKQEYDCPQSDD